MPTPLKILVIEDINADFLLLKRHIRDQGLQADCRRIMSESELDVALETPWNLVLADYNVPGMDFGATLQHLSKRCPDLPVILVTGHLGEEAAVELLRQGLTDFVLKGNLARLVPCIRRALVEVHERSVRRAAELALRESEERLQLALLATTDGLWDWDVGSGYVYRSANYHKTIGRPPDEDTHDFAFFQSTVHPDDLPRVLSIIEAHKQGKTAHIEFDYRLANSPGEPKWIRVTGQVVKRCDNGTPLRIVGTISDVTERKRVELALAEREAQYRAVIETAADGIWVTDEEGRFLVVNEAYVRRSGYNREELLTMRIADLEVQESPDDVRAHIEKVRRTGSDLFETWHRAKSGEVWPAEVSAAYSQNAGGRFFGFLRDLTERKQAFTELQLKEDRLRLAKAAAGLGIFDRDIASGTTECDELVRKLWGFGPDEPISYAEILAGIHPDDRSGMLAAINQACDPHGAGDYFLEYRIINRTDATIRHVLAVGRISFKNGVAERSTGILRDVTEQKLLAKELQERRSEMEQLVNQQVAAQTAAAIAHELNQPLVSISAYSEAALRMLRGGIKNPEKLERALEGAMGQAQRAGQTLHELLDFLHQGEATTEPIDINEIVKEALIIAEQNGYSGFRIQVDLEPHLPPVLANRLQVQKVLVNLLSNSLDAMREAGVAQSSVTIIVRTIAEKHLAQVTVQDSGPGLTPETAHRIFDPFFTTKPKGIGLGLAISRALVEAQGGQLWVELEAEPGATFHFSLPFAS